MVDAEEKTSLITDLFNEMETLMTMCIEAGVMTRADAHRRWKDYHKRVAITVLTELDEAVDDEDSELVGRDQK